MPKVGAKLLATILNMNKNLPTQTKTWLALTLSFAALVSCGLESQPQPLPEDVSSVPLTTRMPSAQSAYTVSLNSGDTLQAIEAEHGGKVVLWRPDRGFAVLGLERDLNTGSAVGARVQDGGSNPESNQRRFLASGVRTWMSGQSSLWAEGQSSLWAEGVSSLWAEGKSILWAEGRYRLVPQNDAVWKKLRLEEAHEVAKNFGRGVKVAVIDTGADLQHPMLRGALVPESEMWDFVGNDAVPQDEGTLGVGGYGHGTNVAGIVLQIAPAAKIMPLRVLGPDGSGDVTNLAAAIDWAVAKGAKVINLSLGSDIESPAVEAALTAATASGALIVSSSGNANGQVSYPAANANVENDTLGWQRLSVTSIDNEFQKSEFANFGPEVEIAAPGETIFGPAPGGRLAAWTGTSMAAPMAAGALALALGQPLKVPAVDLADRLYQSLSGELYNGGNNENYKDKVGKGNLDLKTFIDNVISGN